MGILPMIRFRFRPARAKLRRTFIRMKLPLPATLALCLAVLASAPAGPIPTGKPAAYPDWWFEQDVIARLPAAANKPNPAWPADYPVADDFAAANIGQLKNIATKAVAKFNAFLPGSGAGSPLNTLVATWDPLIANPARDDFSPLNQGQLKQVSSLFYSRLGRPFPWTTTVTTDDDDYSMVNIGQLKLIFSFALHPADDVDADGLLDMWEFVHFVNPSAQTGVGNADTDALSNRAEFLLGTDPNIGADESPSAAAALALVVYSP